MIESGCQTHTEHVSRQGPAHGLSSWRLEPGLLGSPRRPPPDPGQGGTAILDRMRVLGIDLGSRRIGLALSDPDATIAYPLAALERRGTKRDLVALAALIREHAVERVVVGLPIHLNGRHGPEAEAAERFARALGRATELEVDLIDERWTTVEAERALREMGLTGKRGHKRKQHVDAVAASILLRTYLARGIPTS